MDGRSDGELDAIGLLETARLVRSRLTALVGPAAVDLDRRIAALVVDTGDSPEAAARVDAVLREQPAVAGFAALVLADAPHYRPPALQEAGYRGGPPGPGGPVGPIDAAGRYRCVYGDFVWYRLEVGVPVPDCPTHGPVLSPA